MGSTAVSVGNDAPSSPAWNADWLRSSPTTAAAAPTYGSQLVRNDVEALAELRRPRTS